MQQTYQSLVANGKLQADATQAQAIELLQEISRQLQAQSSDAREIVKGAYLWGDVGRGKTWLMDLFFESLDIGSKQRLHYHQFMENVHQALANLPAQSDPLNYLSADMARRYRVICLDEFHVMDIADAVMLHGLLRGLFANGVALITTSNRPPDELYKNGTHRERFLPAIELLKQNTTVFHLDGIKDYRLNRNIEDNVFLTGEAEQHQSILAQQFERIAEGQAVSLQPVVIYGREISVIKSTDSVIWFDFDTLCRGPRSSSDYIEIARRYKSVILSGIPQLFVGEEGPARRFLNLVDEFYDQHVFLLLSSDVSLDQIYQGELLTFEFKRALSRLDEMQSRSYWRNYWEDG